MQPFLRKHQTCRRVGGLRYLLRVHNVEEPPRKTLGVSCPLHPQMQDLHAASAEPYLEEQGHHQPDREILRGHCPSLRL